MKIEEIKSILATQVKALRYAKGLTQDQLGASAGRSAEYIRQIEQGVANPSLKVLCDLASHLGAQVALSIENENADSDE